MSSKSWFNKSVLDIDKSTVIGYPPKDTKMFWAGSFLEAEHFHKDNFGPLQGGFNQEMSKGALVGSTANQKRDEPRGNQFGCCVGIDLPTVTECDDIWVGADPGTSLIIELEAIVPGSKVKWDIINYTENGGTISGSDAISDGKNCPRATALYRIELPFLEVLDLVKMTDDTGCEDSVFISFGEDCSIENGGDPCPYCDCEDTGADCYAECCGWTESGTFQAMLSNDTKQFTCEGGGDWSVAGVGASIDQTGLVTTSGACGTITITNSICGIREVAITDNGTWVLESDTNYSTFVYQATGCNQVSGGSCWEYSWIYQTRTWYNSRCVCDGYSSAELAGYPLCASPPDLGCSGVTPCVSGDTPSGSCAQMDYISRIFINKWGCIP